MKVDIVMPQMGESISEGTIAKWLKKPGEKVERDESVLEISTDKVDSEIPAPRSGILAEILAEEGDTVQVGAVLARIETDLTQTAREQEVTAEAPPQTEQKEAEEEEEVEAKEEEETRRVYTPVVKSIARKEGVSDQELDRIEGSGRGGRVTKEDLLRFLESRPKPAGEPEAAPSPPPLPAAETSEARPSQDGERVEVVPMSLMRKRIAEHMVYSKRVSPHTYTVAEGDLTRIVNFRERVKASFEKREGFKLTYTPFVLWAAVQALRQWPLLNSSVEGEQILLRKYINLGVAVALEEGLIVPVIKNADEKNLLGLARELQDLSKRARERKLKPDEAQNGTFTVTNPGVFGNIFGLPIINQPQVGILGVGAVKKRPVVVGDAIAIRSIMLVTLSYDHRIIDGALAGRFLQTIVSHLEDYDLDNLGI